jgi:hypothetical protein
MNWNESTIGTIASTNVIFFENDHDKACFHICNSLQIDNLPFSDLKHYNKYIDGKWIKCKIEPFQNVESSLKVFDPLVLEKIMQADGKILFLHDDQKLVGVLHHTDYKKLKVFQDLFVNFFLFEAILKKHLIANGIDLSVFLMIQRKKLIHEKGENGIHIKRSEQINKHLRQKANLINNLDICYLRELIQLGQSIRLREYGKKPIYSKIDSNAIGDLRATVMHSVDYTGKHEVNLFNINHFKKFFNQVNTFKEAYLRISNAFHGDQLEEKPELKGIDLEKISKLENDELLKYFLKNQKGIQL